MMIVDRIRYDAEHRREVQRRIGMLAGIDDLSGHAVALCAMDPFELVCAVMEIRERDGSALLLPQTTPHEAALALAEQAGCTALIYGSRITRMAPEGNRLRPGQAGLLQFSSGTTGEPKLIRRPWAEIETEIRGYNEALEPQPGERSIVWVPVTHAFGLITGVFASLQRGSEPIVVTGNHLRSRLRLLREHPVHLLYAVPYLLHLCLSMQPPAGFHRVVSSGAPLTDPLLERLKRVSREVIQQYGCSELGCIAVARHPEAASDVGRLLPHLRLTAPGTRDDPAEWTVSNGRIEVPTRDLGYRDAAGRLQLLGRLDDLINVAGQKVIPSEVERILLRHPGIRDAVVYRTKHPVWGEAVKAMLVPAGEPDEDGVRQWCIERLPTYKIPSGYAWVDAIPRNANGKISRKELERLNP